MITITETLYKKMPDDIKACFNQLPNPSSEEVRECFPDSKAGNYKGEGSKSGGIWSESTGKPAGMEYGDSGNASRFFKSILYYPKASKSERNKGCEGLYWLNGKQIEKELWEKLNQENETNKDNKDFKRHSISRTNIHPTVKNVSLMSYLIKMVTPKGGIVLDPFTGSGSTLVAARDNGFKYIGIEMTEEYIPIIKARTGCEIIHNTKNVIQEEETTIEQEIKEKPIDIQKPKNDIQVCECGGKIKKIASGRCCEWCMKTYNN